MSKILIVYYSRTGSTQKVCQELGKRLGCDLEEVVDQKNRKGIFGFVLGGFDALRNAHTKISTSGKDVEGYDLVILASPVWAGNVAPALRTYIEEHKHRIKKAAFICTSGSGDASGALSKLRQLTLTPLAELSLKDSEIQKSLFTNSIEGFANQLNA